MKLTQLIITIFLTIIAFLAGINFGLRMRGGFKPLCEFNGGKYIVSWDNPKGFNVASCILEK